MKRIEGRDVRNWYGDIVCHPTILVIPESESDVIEIMRDNSRFPSPVRPMGSRHSITPCMSAAQPGQHGSTGLWGTAVDMTHFQSKFEIDKVSGTVTVDAGSLYRTVALKLRDEGWQFHVNTEIGSLSMGAAACGATKDSSFPGEFGQVGSYAVAMKLVDPSARVRMLRDPDFQVPTDTRSDLLRNSREDEEFDALRSSYGLFGIVVEVTFRIKKHETISITHEKIKLREFATRNAQWANDAAWMLLFPAAQRIVVERRYPAVPQCKPQRLRLAIRNFAWRRVSPLIGRGAARISSRAVRDALLGSSNFVLRNFLDYLLDLKCVSPTDQIVNFKAGAGPFTFSMWAFPEDGFPAILEDYFEFCERYRAEHGYRTNMPDVSYRIARDTSSLLSYSHEHPVWTIDPVSSGFDPDWPDFLNEFNEFSSARSGTPLFNQTPYLTPAHARAAFGERLERFEGIRKRYDPSDRMLNDYFYQRLPGQHS